MCALCASKSEKRKPLENRINCASPRSPPCFPLDLPVRRVAPHRAGSACADRRQIGDARETRDPDALLAVCGKKAAEVVAVARPRPRGRGTLMKTPPHRQAALVKRRPGRGGIWSWCACARCFAGHAQCDVAQVWERRCVGHDFRQFKARRHTSSRASRTEAAELAEASLKRRSPCYTSPPGVTLPSVKFPSLGASKESSGFKE
jgi:hypothetical protein